MDDFIKNAAKIFKTLAAKQASKVIVISSPENKEEDENIVCFLINVTENYRIRNGFSSVLEQGNKVIDWFKPLKERIQLQPKQEWSEEDKKMLDTVIEDIIRLAGTKVCYYKDVEWLKSLKPQNRWKPSDEQMEALLKLEEMHVLEHENNQENAHLYMVVKSLREQLLKLR